MMHAFDRISTATALCTSVYAPIFQTKFNKTWQTGGLEYVATMSICMLP